ncbi:DUF4398 domain-containing protein [Aquisalimonas sp.]|uniref:DUF4398 domain-containing protein n=1 Tax=unclassified Aquisalimonas TaxID=2644645 RepID=UPI0025BCBA08|nr:DUF4398 domain-containing protein [Aquisalimonas sp.]
MKTRYGARLTRVALLSTTLAIAVALLSACASTPLSPPTASLTEAKEAIDRAEESEARQYAGRELEEAKHKLEQAERAISGAEGQQDMVEAARLAREARVAADLASARTEAAKAEEVNRQMARGAEALTEEMRRTGEQQ